MKKFLENKIVFLENTKLYSYTEFYRNILKYYNKLNLQDFKNLLDYNIKNSPIYFLSELLIIKKELN
tara:strand:- start:242 stop:442 length:201 start_codon:yes stop_codon:yes gene_type:complete